MIALSPLPFISHLFTSYACFLFHCDFLLLLCYQATQLSHILDDRMKELAEDAKRERAIKDMAEDKAKERAKATDIVEKKA